MGFGSSTFGSGLPIDTLPLNVAPSSTVRRATRTSPPIRDASLPTTRRLYAVTAPLTLPEPEISMSPVASSDPSTVPETCRSPSMNSWPTRRSFGPRTTELPWPLVPLLTGRVGLKVTHPNVSVQRRAVVDLQPAHDDVAAELGVLAEGQLVTRRDRAFDLTLQRHVRALEQRPHARPGRNVDVAAHADLALDLAVGVDRAVVDELAFEDVSGTHRELLAPVAFDLTVFRRSRAFRYRFLNVHSLPPTWNLRAKG